MPEPINFGLFWCGQSLQQTVHIFNRKESIVTNHIALLEVEQIVTEFHVWETDKHNLNKQKKKKQQQNPTTETAKQNKKD